VLICKNVGNLAVLPIRMVAVSQVLATQAQPVIQRIQIVKGKPWAEQLAAQELDLVLDLTLLPSRSGGSRPFIEAPLVQAQWTAVR